MNTQTYAEIINSKFNRNRFSSLVSSIGDHLNARKDRFQKSEIIELSFQIYSDNFFVHIDKIGRDHRDNQNMIDLEFKFISDGLFTKVKKEPKKFVTVKVKNSLGRDKGTTIDNPADFYILAQQDAMAIINFEDLEQYLISVPDGIEAKIPFDALTIVYKPEDVTTSINESVNYKKDLQAAQLKLINSF